MDLITGGDDYELLYTIDPKDINMIDENSYIIGKIIEGDSVKLYSVDNNLINIDEVVMGYKHFLN